MDKKFHPAIEAMRAADVEKFRALVASDPSLATSRSSRSHPTLLQALVLDGKDKPKNVEMLQVLIDAGAELNEPFVAAASIDNRPAAELLLDHGAAIDGTGGWSALEEALYWNSQNVLALLLERGAKVQNLRTAAGLGRIDLIESYFNADGSLKPEAGKIDWPFGISGVSRAQITLHRASRCWPIVLTSGRRIGRASSIMLLSTLACMATSTQRSCCWTEARRSTLFQVDSITRHGPALRGAQWSSPDG